MQRAKERKEEEEKRFEEQKQAAQIKLKKLEASMFANVKQPLVHIVLVVTLEK